MPISRVGICAPESEAVNSARPGLGVLKQENDSDQCFKLEGAERDAHRKECSERYQKHIEAKKLYYPYVDYPYIEWFADNGRVVLELESSQIQIADIQPAASRKEKGAKELLEDDKKRQKAFGNFMSDMVENLSEENRKQGGDGNVTGIVV